MPEASNEEHRTANSEKSESAVPAHMQFGGRLDHMIRPRNWLWEVDFVSADGGHVIEHRETRSQALVLTEQLFELGARKVTIVPLPKAELERAPDLGD